MKNIAFTLVELIVVITILAILATVAFVSFSWYSRDARNSKVMYDVTNLNSAMEAHLSKWESIENLLLSSRKTINWVNSGALVLSWAHQIKDFPYDVWIFDFRKLRMNWDKFKYEIDWQKRDYIFGYLKTPRKFYYQFAWEIKNAAWKNVIVLNWTYFQYSDLDSKGLISEKWYDVWLANEQVLTGSLY